MLSKLLANEKSFSGSSSTKDSFDDMTDSKALTYSEVALGVKPILRRQSNS